MFDKWWDYLVYLCGSFCTCDRYLDLTLLKDPKFITMCLSVMMMSTGCPYMLYFLPAYAISAGMLNEIVYNYTVTAVGVRNAT